MLNKFDVINYFIYKTWMICSELDGIIAQLIPGSFCFDDVLVSHDLKFDWQKNVALFYCGQSWPYNEFGVTVSFTHMYK